jgi:hypothetical protein
MALHHSINHRHSHYSYSYAGLGPLTTTKITDPATYNSYTATAMATDRSNSYTAFFNSALNPGIDSARLGIDS